MLALRLRQHEAASLALQLDGDPQGVSVEVDVRPAQAQHLALTHAQGEWQWVDRDDLTTTAPNDRGRCSVCSESASLLVALAGIVALVALEAEQRSWTSSPRRPWLGVTGPGRVRPGTSR